MMIVILYLCLLIAGIFIISFGFQAIKSRILPDVDAASRMKDKNLSKDNDVWEEILFFDDFDTVIEITSAPAYRKQITIAGTDTKIDIALVNEIRFGPYLHACSINKWEVGHSIDGNFIISSTGKYVAFLFTSYFPTEPNKLVVYRIATHSYHEVDIQAHRLGNFTDNALSYTLSDTTYELLISGIDSWIDCK